MSLSSLRRAPLLTVEAVLVVCLPSASMAQTANGLTLRALLDTVAATFPTIDAARLRIQAADANRRSAGTWANPMLSYQVENTRFPGGGQVAGIDKEAMAMLTLPLEPLYQRGARVQQANSLVQAAHADADVTRQQVARDAARAFYRVARAQARLAALEDVGKWLDTLAVYNRSRVQEGVTAEADLIRTELERDRATMEIGSQRAELARALAELGAFVGDADAANRYATVILPTSALRIDGLASSAQLVATRPELRAAQSRVDAATAAIQSERRMLFRELGATIGTKQMLGTTSMIAGFSLPVPLFDRNTGAISGATAERDAQRRDLFASTRMIQAEYDGAVNAARVLTEQANRLAGSGPGGILARAELAERIALGAYREGAVSLLQVLDASRARSDARMAYYDLLFAQHEAVIDLLFASGQDIRAALDRLTPEAP